MDTLSAATPVQIMLTHKARNYFFFRGLGYAGFMLVWLSFAGILQLVVGFSRHGLVLPLALVLMSVLAVALIVAVLAGLYVYAGMLERSYVFELREHELYLHSGVLNLSNEIMLYERVQDALVTQTLLMRLLGVATLTIQNLAGKALTIPGLTPESAEDARRQVLDHVHALHKPV